MSTKKHSGKNKCLILIQSDCPGNNAERECLKYAKTPSMYGCIKLPVGRPTKHQSSGPLQRIAGKGKHVMMDCREQNASGWKVRKCVHTNLELLLVTQSCVMSQD
jgi:hypothetical protein